MAPQLSPNDRERIILLKLHGHNVAEIGRITGISRQTIHFWLKRWEECGDTTAHRRKLYKRVTTAPQDADIVAAHIADPNLSTEATSQKFNISVYTVRRRIKEYNRKLQQQLLTGNTEQINNTPLVFIKEEREKTPAQKEEQARKIKTHVISLNNQFSRVTNIMSQENTGSNLSLIKRLEKVLTAIGTYSEARAFALAKTQTKKKKKLPTTTVRRKDNAIQAPKKQKPLGSCDPLQNMQLNATAPM
ncbi:uncharacterized protein LOC114358231 isoform X1 [Ostrinia furnacalis]|uniref:uncharacterized protein LOC114358231 isoform X1 n=1 Tax=Ostrinia furnacalis TaxID=93504 RepID=UPI00103CB0AD|nr:uncharacterized protein LOC114358231 isoform X1 [Ostrinia furnacalis]